MTTIRIWIMEKKEYIIGAIVGVLGTILGLGFLGRRQEEHYDETDDYGPTEDSE